MKATNSTTGSLAVAMLLLLCLACRSFTSTGSQNAANAPAASNATAANSQTAPTTKSVENPGLEKADFTVTAEELDREFTRKGVTDKELEKYESKNIAVTG